MGLDVVGLAVVGLKVDGLAVGGGCVALAVVGLEVGLWVISGISDGSEVAASSFVSSCSFPT